MSSLAQSVVRSASTHGDRRAIILDDATLTWSELCLLYTSDAADE